MCHFFGVGGVYFKCGMEFEEFPDIWCQRGVICVIWGITVLAPKGVIGVIWGVTVFWCQKELWEEL